MEIWTHLCTTKLNIAAAGFQSRNPSSFPVLASSCVLTSSTWGTTVEYPNCRDFKERGLNFKRTHQLLPRRVHSRYLAAAVGHVSSFRLRKRCVRTGSPARRESADGHDGAYPALRDERRDCGCAGCVGAAPCLRYGCIRREVDGWWRWVGGEGKCSCLRCIYRFGSMRGYWVGSVGFALVRQVPYVHLQCEHASPVIYFMYMKNITSL